MMKKLRFSFMLLLLTGISINAQAVEPEYNSVSQELSIPSVRVDDNVLVYDVKVKLKGFDLISISEFPSGCPSQNATNFNQIKNGMALDEVNSIIGCEGVLQNSTLDDGVLKTKYLWSFENTPNTASITLAFEKNKLIL